MKHPVALLALLALGVSSGSAAEPKIYETYLPTEIYDSHIKMLDGRDPLEIDDIGSVATWRMVAETLILQVAPVLGGCDCRVAYAPYEVANTPHARSIEQVRRGMEISHGIAGFTDDSRFTDDIALSKPILKGEDFYVGFYTHEGRDEILSLSTDEQISQLRLGVGLHWEIDNLVLARNKLQAVTTDTWNSLVQLLENGRADAVLQPFISGDDLAFVDGVTKLRLIPIPGVKLRFGQGRHYFVSMRHPDGPEFLAALNKGLDMLEDNGTLQRAMEFAGVINTSTTDYRVYKPQVAMPVIE